MSTVLRIFHLIDKVAVGIKRIIKILISTLLTKLYLCCVCLCVSVRYGNSMRTENKWMDDDDDGKKNRSVIFLLNLSQQTDRSKNFFSKCYRSRVARVCLCTHMCFTCAVQRAFAIVLIVGHTRRSVSLALSVFVLVFICSVYLHFIRSHSQAPDHHLCLTGMIMFVYTTMNERQRRRRRQ